MQRRRWSRWAALAIGVAACDPRATPVGEGGDEPRPGGESVAIASSCTLPLPADPLAFTVEQAITYATPDGSELRLDFAKPAASSHSLPLLVLIHGGGWTGGSRSSMAPAMIALAAAGYATAAVDYRLADGARNVYPAPVQDVRCAVRWLRHRAGRFGIDPERVGVLGFSAGAHLGSMLGVSGDDPELDQPCDAGGQPADVAGVIAVAGPHDLRVQGPYTSEQRRLVENFLGAFPGDAPQLAAAASPITRVSPRSAPFLLVHGDADQLVPVEQSRRMRDALQQAGAPATLVELAGVGHTFVGPTTPGVPRAACTMLAFLERWVASPP